MKKFKIALQLFSIREALEHDFEGTLQKVKAIGYDYVELCGVHFFGKSGKEVKEIMDRIGLECISVHQLYDPFKEEGQPIIDRIIDVGAKYCTLPWFDPEIVHNDLDSAMKMMEEYSAAARKSGLKFYYHNHTSELKKVEGECLLDKMMQRYPNGEINPQFDVAFFLPEKEDPAEYIKKYAGRVELVHLKDAIVIEKDGKLTHEPVPVGSGELDIESLLEACEQSGVEYLIVEQNMLPDYSLDGVKESRDYLKSIGL